MSTGTSAILTGAPVTATGGILAAPVGTDTPDSAVEALAEEYGPLGYIGEDGVTKTIDATDEKIKAWGGDVVKIVRQDHSVSYKFSFLESANADVLKAIKGDDNVTVTAPTADHGGQITVKETSKMPPRKAYIFEMRDGDNTIREVVPDGQISASGDVVFVHANTIRYSVTIEAFPDTNGVKAYSHIDDGQTTGV